MACFIEASTLFARLWTPCKMDALMDIEYKQVSKTHQCIRKLAILLEDGETFFVREFKLCMPWQFLELKYQKSFNYC